MPESKTVSDTRLSEMIEDISFTQRGAVLTLDDTREVVACLQELQSLRRSSSRGVVTDEMVELAWKTQREYHQSREMSYERDGVRAALEAVLAIEQEQAEPDILTLQQERDRLREALMPFAMEGWADENGWTARGCPNDRVCDWFGPSDFRAALQALGANHEQ